MAKSIELKGLQNNRKYDFASSGSYSYGIALSDKYEISRSIGKKIAYYVSEHGDEIANVEAMLKLLIELAQAGQLSISDTNSGINRILNLTTFPTANEIKGIVEVCLNEGNIMEEVFKNSSLFDGHIDRETLYSEYKIFKKGRSKIDIEILLKLNNKLSDEERGKIKKLYPLDKRTKFMMRIKLEQMISKNPIEVKEKRHYL